MQLQVYKVPKDFDHPVNTPWLGYLTPHSDIECPECKGTGLSEEDFKLFSEIENQAAKGKIIPVSTKKEVKILAKYGLLSELIGGAIYTDLGWLDNCFERTNTPSFPTIQQVNEFFSKDKFIPSAYSVCLALARRPGSEESKCEFCEGQGVRDLNERELNVVENGLTEPPEGDSFQLWYCEGNWMPVSPVFTSLHELSAWCYSELKIKNRLVKLEKPAWDILLPCLVNESKQFSYKELFYHKKSSDTAKSKKTLKEVARKYLSPGHDIMSSFSENASEDKASYFSGIPQPQMISYAESDAEMTFKWQGVMERCTHKSYDINDGKVNLRSLYNDGNERIAEVFEPLYQQGQEVMYDDGYWVVDAIYAELPLIGVIAVPEFSYTIHLIGYEATTRRVKEKELAEGLD